MRARLLHRAQSHFPLCSGTNLVFCCLEKKARVYTHSDLSRAIELGFICTYKQALKILLGWKARHQLFLESRARLLAERERILLRLHRITFCVLFINILRTICLYAHKIAIIVYIDTFVELRLHSLD